MENLAHMIPGYSNMFPEHADENEAVVYDHDTALAYWLKSEPDEFISCLGMELVSTNSHVKSAVDMWLRLQSEMPNNKIVLTQSMQSVCNTQPEINCLLDAIYIYWSNRRKQKELAQADKLFTMAEWRFPDGHARYIDDIVTWYKKDPIQFLSTIVPIVGDKVTHSLTVIKKLHLEPDLDKIILSTTTMSNGKKSILTFEVIITSLFKTYSILNEGLFLVSSYAQNYERK